MVPEFPTQIMEEIRGLVIEKHNARLGHFRFHWGGEMWRRRGNKC